MRTIGRIVIVIGAGGFGYLAYQRMGVGALLTAPGGRGVVVLPPQP